MCPSSNDTERKVKMENTPLHLSTSNGSLPKNNSTEKPPHSAYPSALDKDGEEKSDKVLASFSVNGGGAKSAKAKSILSLLEDNYNDSSFLANDANAFSGAVSENGSIAAEKEKSDTNEQYGVESINFCGGMIMPGVCQGTTEFAEQMDIFMRCQHPMDLLAIFNEDEKGVPGIGSMDASCNNDVDGGAKVHRVSGYHAIPRACEYCGSHNIDLCKNNPECERPATYFPRKRPPFCSKGGPKWKEQTDAGKASKGGENNVICKNEGSEKQNEDVPSMSCSAWI